jgi:hypothetical protein
MTPAQKQALAEWHAAKQAACRAAVQLIAEQAACPSVQLARTTAQLAAELETRVRESFFPTLEEGTHKIDLGDGWAIKTACTFTRNIDMRIVESLRAPLAATSTSLDALLRWKATLQTKAYRELTAEARAIFDQCLTTTPGTPTLELVPPKVQS